MKCPLCKSKEIRSYYIADDCSELSDEQVNDLTTHEKEIAAQCTCEDCGYTDAAEYFESGNDEPFDLFENLNEIFRPAFLNLSMKKFY
jgi:hypothetical protein